jgi:hypothetical protein
MKFWISYEKGDDSIIAYHENTLYKANPKTDELDAIIANLHIGIPPITNTIDIPLSYIKQIDMEEGKSYIDVLFGKDSSEHLRIGDNSKRNEVFDYLKTTIEGSSYKLDKYSKLRAGKKPLIAMCIVLGIFLWTYDIALGIEQGLDYRLVGSARSLAIIVLFIASLGTLKVVIIFSTLFILALISLIFKIRNPKVVHKINIR